MSGTRRRLQDILDAIAQIEKLRPKGRAVFDESELIQVWMVHHLQIIGEAVRAIDPAFRTQHPSVPWRDISGMRSILVHEYGSIDLNIVWSAVEKDVPLLKKKIQKLLADLPPDQ